MNLLQQSALAWKEITEYRYLFTYGYKKKLYPINLTFSLEDFPHLAGFQYMKDISLPNYTSAKIVDRILEGKISFEKVQKAALYEEMIKPRLEALVHLKNSLDNEFILYSYMPRMYSFITNIKADYLIASHINIDSFIFIVRSTPQGEAKCNFLCCSIFEKGTVIMKPTRDLVPYSKKNAYIFRPIHPQFFWTSLVHHNEAEAFLVKKPLSHILFLVYIFLFLTKIIHITLQIFYIPRTFSVMRYVL